MWYAGYTPEMAGVAMITVDKTNPHFKGTKNPSLTGVRVKGGRLDGSGGGDAGQIWKAAMRSALRDLPKTKFKAPTSEILRGVKVKIPSVSGMGYNEAKRTLEAAGFTTSPMRVFSDRPEGAFLGTTPTGTAVKFSTIYLKLSKGKAPEPKPQPKSEEKPETKAEPVKPPHHQRITLAGEGEGVSQSRPFGLGTAGRVGEHLFTAGRRQGVPLEIHFLIVGRYPRISDFHCVVRQVVR